MEWGPRALGNRSILCDPRRADMKAILNAKIKRREVIPPIRALGTGRGGSGMVRGGRRRAIHDAGFPNPGRASDHSSPPSPMSTGPGACRPFISRQIQRYYRVIEAFRDLTGVPMVLNTSFNENEPVVCEPKEALDCFLRTKMDVLVMGRMMLVRRGGD